MCPKSTALGALHGKLRQARDMTTRNMADAGALEVTRSDQSNDRAAVARRSAAPLPTQIDFYEIARESAPSLSRREVRRALSAGAKLEHLSF